MQRRLLFAIGVMGFVVTTVASAQNLTRRATMKGGGSPNQGKCTIEVVVDGGAEVEIRGDTATLTNLKGQLPQWRRFECTGVMPNAPADFRFAGVDGRGSQRLVRDPRNGGGAVVQIQDPDNGTEGYTFDIFWGGIPNQSDRRDDGRYGDRGPGFRPPFTRDDAVRTCQDAVRQQAAERFNARAIEFRRVDVDNNPGPRDVVEGVFDTRRGFGREDAFRFSCSVNFDTGAVRYARVDPLDDRGRFDRGPSPVDRAIQGCRAAAEDRLRRDGYGNVTVEGIRVDDRPGRRDWIIGNARANSRRGGMSFNVACSVDLNTGDVRSVDVTPR